MLAAVKNALRITVTAYDDELQLLISAALADLGLVGINETVLTTATSDALIKQAVITYCRVHFGTPDDYERLKASYDEQKAQLMMATGYGFAEDAT